MQGFGRSHRARYFVRAVCEHVFVSGSDGYNWKAIRAHYRSGQSRKECQLKFGFSNGAWSRAVERGEIDPRPRSAGNRAKDKRARIGELIAAGLSYRQIAQELGLTKPTVAYHARRLGLPVDERAARRYDWDAIQGAY